MSNTSRNILIVGLSLMALAFVVTRYLTYAYLNPSECNDDGTRCEGSVPQTKEEYEARLQLIMRKVELLKQVSEKWDDAVWAVDDVMFLYQNSERTLELMKQVVIDDSVPVETRKMAVLLSQCRSAASYERLLEFATTKSAQGELDPQVIRTLVEPFEGWAVEPAMSYQDPKMRQLLTALKASRSGTDEATEAVDRVLSGEAADYLRYYHSPYAPAPRVKCVPQPDAKG